jgi:hypothetical protein
MNDRMAVAARDSSDKRSRVRQAAASDKPGVVASGSSARTRENLRAASDRKWRENASFLRSRMVRP